MKLAKMSGKIALIALAAVCLLAAPALCMPMDDGHGRQGGCGMFAPLNNLTAEEMGNITLGELKEMHRQAMDNTTACMKGKGMGEMGTGPVMRGHDDNSGRFDKAPLGMRGASPVMLLIDDLNVEDLSNMTVNQIKALSDKKTAELNNMTLAEIKLLQDKKIQERNNMTLNQLKEEKKNMRQMAQILEGWGFGRHNKA